jgi:structural maintenance of chromosome 1
LRRIEFEKAQLQSTRERLASLRATVEKEKKNVTVLEGKKREIEEELEALQTEVDRQRQKLEDVSKALEEADEVVDSLRDSARKTQRTLDKALKEIASWNDEIEMSASDRHAIYRRCRLEEIELPLVKGSLDKVPIEDVSGAPRCSERQLGLLPSRGRC